MITVPILAIDGPSGSGKGAVARLVAQNLQWHILDSGAVYRALAYAVLSSDTDAQDVKSVVKLASQLPVSFIHDEVFLGDEDITVEIRGEACSNTASVIAAHQPVRAALLDLQRSFAKPPGLVADGRDMGTVVFPQAFLKIYLDATVLERAKRRFLQLKAGGFDVKLHDLEAQIAQRDERDKSRAIAPLMPASDAITIDSTHMSVKDVVNAVLDLVRQRHPIT